MHNDIEPGMMLPEGKTCNDCVHYERCTRLIGLHNTNGSTSCDWFPSLFKEKDGEAPCTPCGK